MWSRNMMSKLSVLLILLMLTTVTKGQTTAEPTTTEEVATSTTTASDTTNETFKPTQQPIQSDVTVTETITTTEKLACVCDCTGNTNQLNMECTTQKANEKPTESNTLVQNDGTTNEPQDVTTSAATTDTDSTTSAAETTPTEADSISTTTADDLITTTPAPVACLIPAELQPHESNCQQYYECSAATTQDGSFHLLLKSCPEKQAFNNELNRCSRDISSCLLPIQCANKGGIADPASNSSYYLCEPRLIGLGFRVFHVDCSSNEIFYPELGKCFLDFNNIPTQSFPPFNWNQIRDIDIVKAEMKLLKQQDKLKLKQEKERQKAEEKLQKELEKQAKKQAKEQEKANKEKVKQEIATFACVEEGNFPSAVSESTYIACINKKGKLKALAMQCGYGATFNAQTGVCINGSAPVDANSVSVEDDDDD